MKTLTLLLLASLAVCISSFYGATAPPTGETEILERIDTGDIHCDFCIPGALAKDPRNQWDPETETFPANIQACAQRDIQHITMQKQSHEEISLRRIDVIFGGHTSL